RKIFLPRMLIGQLIFERFVEGLTRFLNVFPYSIDGRPVTRPIRGQATSNGIDPKRKQAVKFRMEGPETQRSFAQKVPVERLKMPDIKDDAMSLRNGPVVECLWLDDGKERIGIRACFGNAFKELMTKVNLLLGYRHVRMAPLCGVAPTKTLSV